MILDGKVAAAFYKDELKNKIEGLGFKPTLLIVQVNADDGSKAYLNGRLKLADFLGVNVVVKSFTDPTSNELISFLLDANNDKNINGIIVDRPLPKYLDEIEIFSHLDPKKDIDCCSEKEQELGLYVPPTPAAALALIDYYKIDVSNQKVCVIGRSKNVGKPLANLLRDRGANVTVCHSQTLDVRKETKDNDIVFVAMGKREFIDKTYFKESHTVIDIGTHYNEEGKLCGDCNKEDIKMVANYSPVPGGVGPLTNICLFTNLIKAI